MNSQESLRSINYEAVKNSCQKFSQILNQLTIANQNQMEAAKLSFGFLGNIQSKWQEMKMWIR